ncbi:Piso0_000061 [Millerozyma farinosa CBS 7064]|uniref:Piso0_000061 protein n=1 Tax=Pichia sorbitophila (strain ATCC MYA-4447 / BCRC 22081 / CBS 7064 / NBRC 10061 / NRRL Y-12695) TaxID=559304 RepID=G8YSZ9_PICSO|nr:Piso0_000061 [Millerozyma farinosa CBS 7064]
MSSASTVLTESDTLLRPLPHHIKDVFSRDPSSTCKQVLLKEYQQAQRSPYEHATVYMDEQNIRMWYFLLNGPSGTPYERGLYLGFMLFPSDFPYNPPEIQLISPTGRFKQRHAICLSFSSFHSEAWNASWTVEKILLALNSFMASDEWAAGCTEPKSSTVEYTRSIAAASKKWLYYRCLVFPNVFPQEHRVLSKILDTPYHLSPASDSDIQKDREQPMSYPKANSCYSASLMLPYVLNEPLQSSRRFVRTMDRIDDFLQNLQEISLVLADQTPAKHSLILAKYFSLSSSDADVRSLELFYSDNYQCDSSPTISRSFYSDSETDIDVAFSADYICSSHVSE